MRKTGAEILPLVDEELRNLDAAKMAKEKPGQTLQATALVHEAYLRLVKDDDLAFSGRDPHLAGGRLDAMDFRMRFRTAFPNRHVILPVIHVTSSRQALRNASIARDAHAAGIFLINHDIPWKELLLIHRLVMAEHTGWWVGVNCLDLAPEDVFRHIDERVVGVWVDNAMIDERVEKQELADMVLDARRRSA